MGAPYVIMGDVAGRIPGPFLIQALDDNADGLADSEVWDQLAKDTAEEIDGALGKRYSVPFSNPLPAFVSRAAKVIVVDLIYKRRGEAKNPYADEVAAVRKEMESISKGEEPLDPEQARAKPSASVISEPSRTTGSSI